MMQIIDNRAGGEALGNATSTRSVQADQTIKRRQVTVKTDHKPEQPAPAEVHALIAQGSKVSILKVRTANQWMREASKQHVPQRLFDSFWHQGELRHESSLDVFVRLLCGWLRTSDLLQLRWKNFTSTHIVITIYKTRDQLSINLPKRALEILDFYKPITGPDPDAFIFPFLDRSVDYTDKRILFNAISSNTAYANKNLKKLATIAEINKEISFHTSRHTFATRALRKGIPMEYVSKLMGHASLKTTQIYAKVVNEELDKAMKVFN
ncbi:integrase catalytic domain-containing protein [Spirosoma sp. BT702]|uniref:Integrase catalytic domain-containing protein n=1 Tax=Spirosoma profusum TaxID=2771354 RepID=A0A927AR84_9BACT|nr:site-specific integrase [Spirosoma profusum]MBD2701876.1 integrase catalytic domain-containing protein [Spirosoma profusum]